MSKQAKVEVKCCKTCGLWNIDEAKDKGGAVRHPAKCLWECPPLPESAAALGRAGVHVTLMMADYGKECPCWIKREIKTTRELPST